MYGQFLPVEVPQKKGVKVANLTETSLIKCARCGGKKKLARHHKGHEYFFACILEDVYAPIYILFRPEDIAWLCENCHQLAHRLYHKVIKMFWLEVQICFEKLGMSAELSYNMVEVRKIVDKDMCEVYRKKCIMVFESWVNLPKKRRKR